jgi:uncharacterized protein YbaA (DUF1428 family)
MYVNGFVIAVPAENKDKVRTMSEAWWEIAKDYGALEQVETWEVDVPDGEQTDSAGRCRSNPARRSCSPGSSGRTRRPPTPVRRR